MQQVTSQWLLCLSRKKKQYRSVKQIFNAQSKEKHFTMHRISYIFLQQQKAKQKNSNISIL